MSMKSSVSRDGHMPSSGDIIRCGVFKKMKTSRKKYFVLRAETPDALARLEYYDSEKKFRAGLPPKRIIALKTCFNINTKTDSKHKHVIALYTKLDCFCIVFDGEDDLKVWLKDFLTLQHGEELPEGEIPKPKFEYVWHVSLCERGLGQGRTGIYRLCLTDKTVTLVKVDQPIPTVIELSLSNVRSCGHLQNFFFLEVGRMSEIGAGEIWFEADDSNIALNIQSTITHRFKKARQQLATSEAASAATGGTAAESPTELHPKGRNRSASATEPSKTTSKKFNPIFSSKYASSQGGGMGWSTGGNHQRTQSLPFATPIISAPNCAPDNTISLTNHQPICKKAQAIIGGGKCARERCDSMPSRPRTTSEGNHALPPWGKSHLLPYRAHLRDPSHSPPTGSPISPPSDSTGSSYSLPDEHDGHDMEHQRMYSTLPPEEVIAEEEYPESPRANTSGDGYVLMSLQDPYQNDYTYMGGPQGASNSASTSSITSGTPSTEMKCSEYPLEKVFSYVSANDDDTRPGRAYSLGSKPPENQLANNLEKTRTRAFSVGSKKKTFNRVLQPHHHVPGIKSNSAPILGPNSRVGSSHGSINTNPMDDLMEMDFSDQKTKSSYKFLSGNKSSSHCNHKNNSCNGTKGRLMEFIESLGAVIGVDSKKSAGHDGYINMKGGSKGASNSSDAAPYVDMSQGQRLSSVDPNFQSPYAQSNAGPNTNSIFSRIPNPFNPDSRSDYVDMFDSSPSRGTLKPMTLEELSRHVRRQQMEQAHDYIDMNQRQRMNSNSSTYSRAATSPGALSGDHNSDMHHLPGRGSRSDRTDSFGSQLSTSPQSDHIPHSLDELARMSQNSAQDMDGYVPMSPVDLNNPPFHHNRQNSADRTDGDYLNMSKGSVALNAAKDNVRSKPIPIQTAAGNTSVGNSSPLSISSLLGRKASPTGGSPKLHLPLSPYSSLPRQRSPRKSSLQTNSSKDSSVSSSVTTTPSSSSIMFPMSLNSPSSPTVGPTSTAGTPTASAMKVPASILNVPYKPTGHRKKSTIDGYTMMDFEPKKSPVEAVKVDESAYMNYCPPTARVPRQLDVVDTDYADYAIMKPSYFSSFKTLPRKSGAAPPPLVSPLVSAGPNDRHSMCFMPIQESNERINSSTPECNATQGEKLDRNQPESNPSEGYDRLKSPSPSPKSLHPNSSNSETIKTQVQRPASTTGSEKPPSRPPSECSEGLTSRLGSNSSVYSSSSSASTVVGVVTNQLESEQAPQHVVRLHYASLELSCDPLEGRRSPKATSETNLNDGDHTTFVYADIDFVKSEELSRNGAPTAPNVSSSSSNNSASIN
ncbi:insulin receptor substrate 1-B isoform X3 [Dendroctonus ponderosae]|uniref:Insulin receptor substrate 1 n=1 Tax=Dendroctonus ponderosae TaxID=77166 RepID=A0AAR5QAG6_DENPD|nr:insulin receptor substrate 1-B isoform X3 [Dendroctonus ponderosae]